jgi:serine/threonine-protein kinase
MPERIGKYEIRDVLGRGGFGQVYLGFDPTVGRQVAIKVLTSDGDPNTLRRFRAEANSAGNLRHKNIVTIHELGEDHGTLFIAMEFLEGQDLQHIIASRAPLSLPEKIRIMSQAAEGLHCAHQHGVVHRDVKPANIMVLNDGSVKLMDFGIARLTRDRSTRLTQAGYLVGTVFYMAPEQLNGQDVDARCDIWAFGAIYYELLSGRHPFDSPDVSTAILRIMQQEPAPVNLACPECPSALAAVLTRLLTKDRETRYQNFEDVLFDTAPILLDLESQQSKQLVSQAQTLMRKGNLEDAQALVKRVLAHDPAHEQGRALWQVLQADIRHRSSVLRARSMTEQAEKAAAAGDFAAAIGALESAARIDPADTSITARLAELRDAKQRADLAARLLSNAYENVRQNHLSAAFQVLREALNAQPSNTEAQRLLSDVQNRIAEAEAQRQIDDALVKVEGLLARQSFDEAIRILEDLSRQAPGSERVCVTFEQALQQRQEYERALQSGIEAARNEISGKQFEAAVSRLEGLASRYPGQSEVASLLAYARGEWEAAQHMAKIRAAATGAWKLLKAQKYDEALTEADAALLKFPNDPALLRLRQTIVSQQAEYERNKFIQQTLADCAELDRKGDTEQACATLEKGLERYPSEPALTEPLEPMRQKAALQRKERERAAALERDLRQADNFVVQGQPWQAIQLLTQVQASYPGESRVSTLLNRLQEEERRRVALEALRAEAQRFVDAGDADKACDAVARGRREFGADSKLIALGTVAEKLREAKLAEQERSRFVAQTLAECAEAERTGRLEPACAILEKALQRYSAEPALTDALARMRQKLLQQQEQERAAKIERERQQKLLQQQEQERAAKIERERQQKLLQQQEKERAAKAERERQALLQQQEEERAAKAERERQQKLLQQQEEERAAKAERERQALLQQQEEERAAKAERERQQKLLQQIEQERTAKIERQLRPADTHIVPAQPPAPLPTLQTPAYLSETRAYPPFDRAGADERRRAELDALCAEIQRLLNLVQLDRASELVARGQRDFGPDPKLIALKTFTEQLRNRRITLERARMAFLKRNWRVAADALEGLLRQDEKDVTARRMLEQVKEQERTDPRRIRIDGVRKEAEKLMQSQQFQEAALRLRALQAEFPDDRAIAEDLVQAIEAITRQTRGDAYIQARSRVDALARVGQYQAAVNILEELAGQYPGDAALQQELSAARQILREQNRRERYPTGRRQAAELAQAHNFKDAIALLETLQAEFPGDAGLQEDLKSARELQERSAWLDREVAQLEQLHQKGDARAVLEHASAIPADLVDARVRTLLDWATAELAREESSRGTLLGRLSQSVKPWWRS